jgi:hypothetical protein
MTHLRALLIALVGTIVAFDVCRYDINNTKYKTIDVRNEQQFQRFETKWTLLRGDCLDYCDVLCDSENVCFSTPCDKNGCGLQAFNFICTNASNVTLLKSPFETEEECDLTYKSGIIRSWGTGVKECESVPSLGFFSVAHAFTTAHTYVSYARDLPTGSLLLPYVPVQALLEVFVDYKKLRLCRFTVTLVGSAGERSSASSDCVNVFSVSYNGYPDYKLKNKCSNQTDANSLSKFCGLYAQHNTTHTGVPFVTARVHVELEIATNLQSMDFVIYTLQAKTL